MEDEVGIEDDEKFEVKERVASDSAPSKGKRKKRKASSGEQGGTRQGNAATKEPVEKTAKTTTTAHAGAKENGSTPLGTNKAKSKRTRRFVLFRDSDAAADEEV